MHSIASGATPAPATIASMSWSSAAAVVVRSPSTCPSDTSAQVATSVAVSNASTIGIWACVAVEVVRVIVDGDEPPVPPGMREAHLGPGRWEAAYARLRPFDEHDRALEIRLEVSPL